MTDVSPRKDSHVVLPPERFYWAVLDASMIPKGSSLLPSPAAAKAGMGYLFESSLPIPIDDLHAVYTPLDGSRILACGADRAELQRHLEDGAQTLLPASVPLFLTDQDRIDPNRLNLLTGPFVPPIIRHARTRWLAQLALVLLLTTAVLCLGLELRADAEIRAAASVDSDAKSIYDQVLTPSVGPAQPPAARLLGELRALRQTRGPVPATAALDAGNSLAQLLALWPASTRARVESLVVTPSNITLIADVPDHEHAQHLASAIGALDGWRAEQPQVSQSKENVRLTARLTRTHAPGEEVRQ